jgi:hypothetical protein
LFLPIDFVCWLIAKIAGLFVDNRKDVDAIAITHYLPPHPLPLKIAAGGK